MGILPPSSRHIRSLRFSAFDAIWATLSPLIALYVRDALVVIRDDTQMVALYCAASVFFSLGAFMAFRLQEGMSRYFSVHDAIQVAKAVILAELMTSAVLFTFTRLDGIPRSTPIIHALILGAGLIAARTLSRIAHNERETVLRRRPISGEGMILIGLNKLSYAYIKCLETVSRGECRVIAILDSRPHTLGRSIHGVRVMGPPSQLESLIQEFQVHGIHTGSIVISGDETFLSSETHEELQRVCAAHAIRLNFMPQLFGLSPLEIEAKSATPFADESETLTGHGAAVFADLPLPYLFLKRLTDLVGALGLLLLFSPLWIASALVAFLNVGSPVFFWQQRIGLNGRNFLLYKLRTLGTPFDWRGQKITDEERLSRLGELLRRVRLDEWPQLLNVLVGDMSLIGPRPLLPKDQPSNPARRLMMRPGLTGWAQVNGGSLLSPEEKDSLDDWYVGNASLQLDLLILWRTVMFLIRGDHRDVPSQGLRNDRMTAQKVPLVPAPKT